MFFSGTVFSNLARECLVFNNSRKPLRRTDTVIFRTKILHVYGFESMILSRKGEVLQNTGSTPGIRPEGSLVCEMGGSILFRQLEQIGVDHFFTGLVPPG